MNKRSFISLLAVIAVAAGGALWYQHEASHDHDHDHDHDHSHGHSHGHSHDHGGGEHEHDNQLHLKDEEIKKMGITINEAKPGEITQTLSTRGVIILHPDNLAHILPKISGVAKEAKKNIGDSVKQGEVIAVLESREMADAKAAYLASLEKQQLAQTLLDRETRLKEKKVSAEQDYITAKSSLEETKINTHLTRQKLRAFGLLDDEIELLEKEQDPDLRLYEIRSPIDGTVINRHITKGEFIENTATIYEIANLDKVWVEIGIYPKDLSAVNNGQMVDISLPGDGLSTQAKIIYVSPIIKEETITSKAVAEIPNPERKWRPGTFVKVNIVTNTSKAPVVVPKEAVQNIDNQDVVFVLNDEGFEKRNVETGLRDDKSVEIKKGLNPGEKYASNETFMLKAELGKESVEHEH
jgi:cobalt-zinc-cadmium efflux system membrane fusion protein